MRSTAPTTMTTGPRSAEPFPVEAGEDVALPSEFGVGPGAGVAIAAPGAGAANATTFLAAGASSRPSATAGVGKWFAGGPTVACWRILPVAGSRP
jgi:hypothetical protein